MIEEEGPVVPCDRVLYDIERCYDYMQYTHSNIVLQILTVGNLDCKRFFTRRNDWR